jgi:hypothetical protein
MNIRQALQEMIVGVQARGRLTLYALDLGLLHFGRDGGHYARCNPILEIPCTAGGRGRYRDHCQADFFRPGLFWVKRLPLA